MAARPTCSMRRPALPNQLACRRVRQRDPARAATATMKEPTDAHEICRYRLPRLQPRPRHDRGAGEDHRPSARRSSGTPTATCPAVDLIVLPGGFSYGDYLRSGAIAARAPVMRTIAERAAAGVPVLGICNGFQILCEAGLLPGVLMRNASLRFICREVHLRVETTDTLFTNRYRRGPGPAQPGRPRRRQLSLRRGHAEAPHRRRPGRLPLRRRRRQARRPMQSQRLDRRHRRHTQRTSQCARHDAPPGRPIEDLQGGTDGRGLFESILNTLVAAA